MNSTTFLFYLLFLAFTFCIAYGLGARRGRQLYGTPSVGIAK